MLVNTWFKQITFGKVGNAKMFPSPTSVRTFDENQSCAGYERVSGLW